jgi:3-methyladenine DNA glycosylase Tag
VTPARDNGLVRSADGVTRCWWPGDDALYQRYHDDEWGWPVDDVRHRGKIESAINNAKRALDVRNECGSLAAYFWRWEPDSSLRPRKLTRRALTQLAHPPVSAALSKDLKQRGWTFVGPTTIYAFMQAMGLVNDHLDGCATRLLVEDARAAFRSPASRATRSRDGSAPKRYRDA